MYICWPIVSSLSVRAWDLLDQKQGLPSLCRAATDSMNFFVIVCGHLCSEYWKHALRLIEGTIQSNSWEKDSLAGTFLETLNTLTECFKHTLKWVAWVLVALCTGTRECINWTYIHYISTDMLSVILCSTNNYRCTVWTCSVTVRPYQSCYEWWERLVACRAGYSLPVWLSMFDNPKT